MLEMLQLDKYKIFGNLGHSKSTHIPVGYKKIWVHLVYTVKHNNRLKAQLIAEGHLTKELLDNVYLGVVSLNGVWLVAFLAELNGLKLWATNIGNA